MTPLLKAERYSHGVRLSGYSREIFAKLTIFLETLALKEPRRLPRGGMVMELKKRFYGVTHDHREVFIHRNTLATLLDFLQHRGVDSSRVEIVDIPIPESSRAKFEPFPHLIPHDYQVPIIAQLSDDLYSRRLDLQTGKGKTLSALMAAAKIGRRILVMVAPKYFGIWTKALEETYQGMEGRYCTVSGSAELQALIEQGVNGTMNYDVVIMSMVSYRTYIEAYERFGKDVTNMGYLVPPTRFHEALGFGVQINDEIQDDPGLVFRIDVFTNVQKQIYLSATPYTGSEYVTQMINVMLPQATECQLPTYDAFINVISLLYNDPTVQPKDYLTPFKNTYNHGRYESRMLKHKKRLDRYFAMVDKVINGIYAKDCEQGQKLLLLCATVEFIKVLTAHIKERFPQFRVGLHVAGSNYKDLMLNDITVSTIKSAGTGVDIPNLRETFLLQATDSKKDNIQILGRTRKLKGWPDHTPRLTYLVCSDVPQHLRYHASKLGHFAGKVKSHRMMRV